LHLFCQDGANEEAGITTNCFSKKMTAIGYATLTLFFSGCDRSFFQGAIAFYMGDRYITFFV
jgi:hypothetical protein